MEAIDINQLLLLEGKHITAPQNDVFSDKLGTKHRKQQCIRVKQTSHLKELLKRIPEKGEVYHIISSGDFDYFTFIPVLIDLLDGKVEECYITTWGLSNFNVNALAEMLDKKKILKLSIIIGDFIKKRYPDIYANLVIMMQERRQEIRECRNHAKIIMMRKSNDYIIAEGSANLTGNPRIEQTCVFNDKRVYKFHETWMQEILKQDDNEKAKKEVEKERKGKRAWRAPEEG